MRIYVKCVVGSRQTVVIICRRTALGNVKFNELFSQDLFGWSTIIVYN